MNYSDDEIQNYALQKIGRFLTEEEMARLRRSNVRSATQIGSAIMAFSAVGGPIGVAAALGAATLAKPAYNIAKDIPIVGDFLDGLEDIFG